MGHFIEGRGTYIAFIDDNIFFFSKAYSPVLLIERDVFRP